MGEIDFDKKFTAIKIHFGEPGNLAFLRPELGQDRGGLCPRARRRQALSDRLQHLVRRRAQKRARSSGFRLSQRLLALLHRLPRHHCGRPQGHGRGLCAGRGRRIRQGGQDRPGHHGCGRVHLAEPLQGPRKRGLRRRAQEHRHGLAARARARWSSTTRASRRSIRAPAWAAACAPRICAHSAITITDKKAHIDHDKCVGCGRCIGVCPTDAVSCGFDESNIVLNRKIAEYTKAVVDGRPCFHISLVIDVSPNCDCHAENDVAIVAEYRHVCVL